MSEPTTEGRWPQLTDAEIERLRWSHDPLENEGHWTTEPPTVPGWYWTRCSGECGCRCGSLNARRIYGGAYFGPIREWWTVPIQEPKHGSGR